MRTLLFLSLSIISIATFSQVGSNQKLTNPNLAEKSALLALPNVSEAVADAIISGRPFLTNVQLDEVLSGNLNQEQRVELYKQLFRPLNLNTAS